MLVDRIVEMGADFLVGIKNVTPTAPFFMGHFPDFPVMPGVLILEAMAQCGGILVLKDLPDRHNKLVLFASIKEAKFRKPVLPGDILRLELKVLKRKSTVVKMQGTATVDGQVVAEGIVMCKVVGKPTRQGAPQG